MTQVHVTGCGGFIGRECCRELLRRGMEISGSSRIFRNEDDFPISSITSLGPETDWQSILQQTEVVIHLAARAHVLKDSASDPLAEFRRVNCTGTLDLARQAAAIGVRRFIFLSSIGVNGANTQEASFTEKDKPNPQSAYAVAKWEAEQGLRRVQYETGMDVVIIRPPLVYGPNPPGNMGRLLEVISKGLPLPFGFVRNQRSFVALENLVDLIVTCIEHPVAANETFLVSDGEDLSTPELIRRIASHMNLPARLLPVPVGLLRLGGKVMGKSAEIDRLCGSLQIDISKTERLLGWTPPVSVEEALIRTTLHFMEHNHS